MCKKYIPEHIYIGLLLFIDHISIIFMLYTQVYSSAQSPDPCLSSPCLSGGSCVKTVFNTYSCTCVPNTEGIHCQYSKFWGLVFVIYFCHFLHLQLIVHKTVLEHCMRACVRVRNIHFSCQSEPLALTFLCIVFINVKRHACSRACFTSALHLYVIGCLRSHVQSTTNIMFTCLLYVSPSSLRYASDHSGVKLGSGCRLPLADSKFQDPIQIVRIRFEKRDYNDYYKPPKLIRGTNL